MNEIRYETPMNKVNFDLPTIFLAGPTVRGNQPHLVSWRSTAVIILRCNGFDGNVIIPEFTSKTESDKYRYDLPIWENEGLTRSKVIAFWVERTRELIALITNHEIARWTEKDRNKVIYGRPDNAYRIMYNDIMWVQDAKERTEKTGVYVPCPIYNTLEKTMLAAVLKMNGKIL